MQHKDEHNSVATYEADTKTYLINGYKYKFIRIHKDGGLLRGYCPRRRKHAYLQATYVMFDGELAVKATPVEE